MEKLNPYMLLAISLVITLCYSVLRNDFSKRIAKTTVDYYMLNLMSNILSIIVLLFCGVGMPSPYTLAIGIAFGMATALAAITNLMALHIGPFSYTSVIITASMIIPALSGRLIWQEPVSVRQYAGMLLMIVSIILGVDQKGDGKKSSVKWMALCLTTFLLGGSIGVMQKFHQSSIYKDERIAFLLVAFTISMLFSLGMVAGHRKKDKEYRPAPSSSGIQTLVISVISGICIALANLINLFLSGVVDSAVLFPALNGGGLLLTTLAAFTIFKERPSKKQWYGLSIGMVAIMMLCIT